MGDLSLGADLLAALPPAKNVHTISLPLWNEQSGSLPSSQATENDRTDHQPPDGKEVYYKAADTVQAQMLHHMIEQAIEISCLIPLTTDKRRTHK